MDAEVGIASRRPRRRCSVVVSFLLWYSICTHFSSSSSSSSFQNHVLLISISRSPSPSLPAAEQQFNNLGRRDERTLFFFLSFCLWATIVLAGRIRCEKANVL
jgi:hypothetical protein